MKPRPSDATSEGDSRLTSIAETDGRLMARSLYT